MRFRVSSRQVACSSALGLALLFGGCAHSETAADRHFAELNDQLGKVQADQDRGDNKELFDAAPGDESRGGSRVEKPGPAARTVSIGDDESSRESDDPNDPNARPEIRLQGSGGGSSRPLRGKSRRGEARIEAADEVPHDGASRASVLDPEAKKTYESALSLAQSRQYDRALDAFAAFLVKYPDHPYAENALYWRGECYFARGEFLRAAEQFEAVLARFGGGNKAPDALLKIGVSHERLGASDRAREYWDRLRRDYPRSDAAKKIPQSNESSARGAGPKENR